MIGVLLAFGIDLLSQARTLEPWPEVKSLYVCCREELPPAIQLPKDEARTNANDVEFTTINRAVKPWSGLISQSVTPDIAESLGIDDATGVVISYLHPLSSFRASGLEVGDVVLETSGTKIDSSEDLESSLRRSEIGASVVVKFKRAGNTEVVAVQLSQAPDEPPAQLITLGEETPVSGMIVADANPMITDRLDLRPSAQGVVILDPGWDGRLAGLQRGDVVITIGKISIAEASDTKQAFSELKSKVPIVIRRESRTHLIEVNW